MKEKAIVDTGNDFRKRREISRINPAVCPYIKKIAADQELAKSKKEGRSRSLSKSRAHHEQEHEHRSLSRSRVYQQQPQQSAIPRAA